MSRSRFTGVLPIDPLTQLSLGNAALRAVARAFGKGLKGRGWDSCLCPSRGNPGVAVPLSWGEALSSTCRKGLSWCLVQEEELAGTNPGAGVLVVPAVRLSGTRSMCRAAFYVTLG